MSLDEIGLKYGTDKASVGHDYLKVYEREIPLHPGSRSFLELGWWDGASMRMWREWLPKNWDVTGLDIDPKESIDGVAFIQGGQDDPHTIEQVAQTAGPFDVIVDDASHISPLTIKSFVLLWPHLKTGGLYFVEDLQVSYHTDWLGWDDSVSTRGRTHGQTSMQFLKKIADAVHSGHAGAGPQRALFKNVARVSFWPGLCMVQKKGIDG